MCIIDKVKDDARKGYFFARKSLENNWGRAVLLNFLSSDLYERHGAAQTNFALTLSTPESDLAQELLKSPYDFSFLPGKEEYQEAELKRALIDHIMSFMIELGKGFSFVGKEYRLVAGGKEKFIGLLICKEKNTVLARYALSTINRPIGISEYELARQQLPDDLKDTLPSPEEIEKGLMGD